MNQTAVEEIRHQAEALLEQGPRSRDTVTRRMIRDGFERPDIEAALEKFDWQAQAAAVLAASKDRELSPRGLHRLLLVSGFTGEEIDTALSTVDYPAALQVAIDARIVDFASREQLSKELQTLGFDAETVASALAEYDEQFWKEQARQALNRWAEEWDSYESCNPKSYLRECGFTPAEIEFAAANAAVLPRELARREAQALYDSGIGPDGIELALQFSGLPDLDIQYAMKHIEWSSKPDEERRAEAYMSADGFRTEKGLHERIGPHIQGARRKELLSRIGADQVDWIALNRDMARNYVQAMGEGEEAAAGNLLDEGFSETEAAALLEGTDWVELAAEAGQNALARLQAFTPDGLERVLLGRGFREETVKAALDRVSFPAWLPEDELLGQVRARYCRPAIKEEVLQDLRYSFSPARIEEALESADLDWDRPLRQLVELHVLRTELGEVPVPSTVRAKIMEDLTEELPYDPLERADYDWVPHARALIRERQQDGETERMIRQDLRRAGFDVETIAAATEAEGFAPAVTGDAADHLRYMIESTRFSRPGIEAEMEELGYGADETAAAAAAIGLDLDTVDWRKRAQEWIRNEAAQMGLSRQGVRMQLEEEGYSRRDIAWAVAKTRVDYVANALRRAQQFMSKGLQQDEIEQELREEGFDTMEILGAMKRLQK